MIAKVVNWTGRPGLMASMLSSGDRGRGFKSQNRRDEGAGRHGLMDTTLGPGDTQINSIAALSSTLNSPILFADG